MSSWATGGSRMDRKSNASSNSTGSMFSNYSFASSATTMSYGANPPSPVDYNGFYPNAYDHQQQSSVTTQPSHSYDSGSPGWTPTLLGWQPNTNLCDLYRFVVQKGEKPYLELLPASPVTASTPQIVFLDSPRSPKKGSYPCQYPGVCENKKKDFGRAADLSRHYMNVHGSVDFKEKFYCDYLKCARAEDPFNRKDHYRDHLRDFHKEDLGCAKNQKRQAGDKKRGDQRAWLAERRISTRHWRCVKCLTKVQIATHGYECSECHNPCEEERMDARLSLKMAMPGAPAPPDADFTYDYCSTCGGNGVCDGLDTMGNSFAPCPNCQPTSQQSYYADTWDNNGFDFEYYMR